MIPYEVDPSLHDSELPLESLDDGFSPPTHEHEGRAPLPQPQPGSPLGEKSPF